MNLTKDKKLVPISQAAEILGVSIDTIRRWDKAGIIKSGRPNGKDRYFSIEELEKHKFQKPLSISQASEKLGVSATTLRRLEKKGLIKPLRNGNSERLYDKKSLEGFLNSEYFLREKEVEEKILEPLTPQSKKELKPKEKIDEVQDQTLHVVNSTVKSVEEKVGSLLNFQKAFYNSGLFLATLFVLLVIIITALFLFFPQDTANFFGYAPRFEKLAASDNAVLGASFPNNRQRVNGNVVGRLLKPFSRVSLGLVGVISPQTHEKIVPAKQIADELGGEVGNLPSGETKPQTDILVILGK